MVLRQFCYESGSKIAITPTIFTGKHVKFPEIILENNDLRELIHKYVWFWPKRLQNNPEIVRDSNFCLKLQTSQLSNVRGLETI